MAGREEPVADVDVDVAALHAYAGAASVSELRPQAPRIEPPQHRGAVAALHVLVLERSDPQQVVAQSGLAWTREARQPRTRRKLESRARRSLSSQPHASLTELCPAAEVDLHRAVLDEKRPVLAPCRFTRYVVGHAAGDAARPVALEHERFRESPDHLSAADVSDEQVGLERRPHVLVEEQVPQCPRRQRGAVPMQAAHHVRMVVDHQRRAGPPGGADDPPDVPRRRAPVFESSVHHDHHDVAAPAQRADTCGQPPLLAARRATFVITGGDVADRLVVAGDRGAAHECNRASADTSDRR